MFDRIQGKDYIYQIRQAQLFKFFFIFNHYKISKLIIASLYSFFFWICAILMFSNNWLFYPKNKPKGRINLNRFLIKIYINISFLNDTLKKYILISYAWKGKKQYKYVFYFFDTYYNDILYIVYQNSPYLFGLTLHSHNGIIHLKFF